MSVAHIAEVGSPRKLAVVVREVLPALLAGLAIGTSGNFLFLSTRTLVPETRYGLRLLADSTGMKLQVWHALKAKEIPIRRVARHSWNLLPAFVALTRGELLHCFARSTNCI